jgi:hypothetical protein
LILRLAGRLGNIEGLNANRLPRHVAPRGRRPGRPAHGNVAPRADASRGNHGSPLRASASRGHGGSRAVGIDDQGTNGECGASAGQFCRRRRLPRGPGNFSAAARNGLRRSRKPSTTSPPRHRPGANAAVLCHRLCHIVFVLDASSCLLGTYGECFVPMPGSLSVCGATTYVAVSRKTTRGLPSRNR